MRIRSPSKIRAEYTPPPDKSMTHRALFFSVLSSGKSIVYNPLASKDVDSTQRLLKAIGMKINREDGRVILSHSKFTEPFYPIDCGNSGTTARIGAGLLARFSFFSMIYGDESLSKRPMMRVVKPLRKLGAYVDGREHAKKLPLCIRGGNLEGTQYSSDVSSAQVKTAFIFAALNANNPSMYFEPLKSRDHTERFLSKFSLIEEKHNEIHITPGIIPSFEYEVKGDFSSAAFFLVLALIHPNARLKIKNVGLNPTRTGLLNVMKRMGANVHVERKNEDFEPYGDVYAESSQLHSTAISKEEIPSMVDEVPLIALLGAFAEGETVVKGAEELRKKESDRVKTTVEILKQMGANIEESKDGFRVRKSELHAANVDPKGDHRMAMMAAVAGACIGGISLKNEQCVSISYPEFFSDLKEVTEC